MSTYAKEGAHRCFDLSQDINWHGNADKLWNDFKQKFPQYNDISNKEMKDTMDGFFKYCSNVLVDTPHGIVLTRIGYISMTVFDAPKKVVKWFDKIISNYKTEFGEVYRCYYYPIRKWNTPLKGFMFSLSYPLKERIKNKIAEGMKYYNHIKLLDKNPRVIKYS